MFTATNSKTELLLLHKQMLLPKKKCLDMNYIIIINYVSIFGTCPVILPCYDVFDNIINILNKNLIHKKYLFLCHGGIFPNSFHDFHAYG